MLILAYYFCLEAMIVIFVMMKMKMKSKCGGKNSPNEMIFLFLQTTSTEVQFGPMKLIKDPLQVQ